MISLTELEKLCDEATSGEWTCNCHGYIHGPSSNLFQSSHHEPNTGAVREIADGRFIAAANPQTVKELIRRLRVAREALDFYAKDMHWTVALCTESGNRGRQALREME